jgi:hypothetical protein
MESLTNEISAGQLQMTGKGWGFNIVNGNRAPIVGFCYRDQTDAAKARTLIEETIRRRNTNYWFSPPRAVRSECAGALLDRARTA